MSSLSLSLSRARSLQRWYRKGGEKSFPFFLFRQAKCLFLFFFQATYASSPESNFSTPCVQRFRRTLCCCWERCERRKKKEKGERKETLFSSSIASVLFFLRLMFLLSHSHSAFDIVAALFLDAERRAPRPCLRKAGVGRRDQRESNARTWKLEAGKRRGGRRRRFGESNSRRIHLRVTRGSRVPKNKTGKS